MQQGNFTVLTSFLNIHNIQDEDEGRYQCVISNNFGSVYSNKARITVHGKHYFIITVFHLCVQTYVIITENIE